MSTSGIPDYLVVSEKIRLCLEKYALDYTELWITLLRDGYRIEVFPAPSMEKKELLAACISRELNVDSIMGDIVEEPIPRLVLSVKWSTKG